MGTRRNLEEFPYFPQIPLISPKFQDSKFGVDYFVSFDRKHLVSNPRAEKLPFPIGMAGDFLAWYREWLKENRQGG